MMKKIRFVLHTTDETARDAAAKACAHLQKEGLDARVTGDGEDTAQERETLFVCDDPADLKKKTGAGCRAIAYRHAANRAADFSGVAYIFEEIEEIDADSYIKAYQRLSGEPWEILETKRLRLRESTVEDVDAFYEIYQPPEMTRYMEGLFGNPEDEKRYMADYIRNVYALTGFGVWTVIEKETGDIVGRCGYSVRGGFENTEIGFLVGVPWQKKGYATEMIEAVLAYGKEALLLDRVQALVKEGNGVSLRLLYRLGFEAVETLEVEEDIYGGIYPGEGNGRRVRAHAQKGRYVRMLKTF